MGGLLGIPHYSKLEFVFLLFTSAGFWLTWVHDPEVILVTVLGILALLIWRSVRFLDPDYYVAIGVCGGIGVA